MGASGRSVLLADIALDRKSFYADLKFDANSNLMPIGNGGPGEAPPEILIVIDEGATVLVSSHLLSEVEQMCSHLGVMHAGKLVAQGTSAEVRAGTQHQAVVETDQAHEAGRIMEELGLLDVRVTRTAATGNLNGIAPDKIVAACVHQGVPVLGFRVGAPSLEDVFVSLTSEAAPAA